MSESLVRLSEHLYRFTDTANVYLVVDGGSASDPGKPVWVRWKWTVGQTFVSEEADVNKRDRNVFPRQVPPAR